MTPDEYAAIFALDLELATLTTDRSEQQADGRIGFSDFDCPERMRRIITKSPVTDSPTRWAAFVGTALDKEIKQARQALHPELVHDVELTLTFPNGFQVTGHPDELDPSEPSYTDYKSKNGLALHRRTNMDDQARLQRHLNFLAAYQEGYFAGHEKPLRDGIVRNVAVDRSGKDDRPHVEQEPFSPAVVQQAEAILTDVLYAVDNGEEAAKTKPRYWCKRFCPFYTACRGGEVAEEYRRDDRMAELAAIRYEANELVKVASAASDEAKAELDGYTGVVVGAAGRYRVRTTVVNAKTGPYSKVEVEPVDA